MWKGAFNMECSPYALAHERIINREQGVVKLVENPTSHITI